MHENEEGGGEFPGSGNARDLRLDAFRLSDLECLQEISVKMREKFWARDKGENKTTIESREEFAERNEVYD
jgi:hypothetical protein